ncbi:MAG: extracellular solute-binding protein [Candidatus Liptonbacteria bacterium]|nr:extracellular solute-binding protein [Candidatus Liptonbacteria bacterium]
MNFSKNKLILIAGVALLVIGVFLAFTWGKKPPIGSADNLVVWGVEESRVLGKAIEQYRKANQGAEVRYVQVPAESYEETLLSALAAGRGPDVLYISNHSLPKLRDVLAPLNPVTFSAEDFRQLFPTVATDDFVYQDKIYALPLYIDTLAMVYNRDMFDRASIASPPATWEEFQKLVPKLRILNEKNQIVRAAVPIGGTEKTVNYATDILSLLMLQNGAEMINKDFTSARFAGKEGVAALDFYLQFSNPNYSYYTWNEAQRSSLDSFAAGESAAVFAYKSDIPLIKAKNPFSAETLEVAPMLQVSEGSAVNYPDYWGLAVSAQSKHVASAWNFAMLLTTNENAAKDYVFESGHPPALRSLLAGASNSAEFGVFAKQALSARSWHTVDYGRIKEILNSAIVRAISGQVDTTQALREAAESVTLLMK